MPGPACPKCGHTNAADAVICGSCDYILDTSFLGDDILNQPTTDDASLPRPPTAESSGDFGGEALILGNLQNIANQAEEFDSFLSDRTGSFLTADTADIQRIVEPAPVYVDKATQMMLEPHAVLTVKPGTDLNKLQLSPFEQHVLSFIDGKRPNARIRKKAGLTANDAKIALAMILDRGILKLVGNITRAGEPLAGASLGDEDGDDDVMSEIASVLDDPSGVITAPTNLRAVEPLEDFSEDFAEQTLPVPEAPNLSAVKAPAKASIHTAITKAQPQFDVSNPPQVPKPEVTRRDPMPLPASALQEIESGSETVPARPAAVVRPATKPNAAVLGMPGQAMVGMPGLSVAAAPGHSAPASVPGMPGQGLVGMPGQSVPGIPGATKPAVEAATSPTMPAHLAAPIAPAAAPARPAPPKKVDEAARAKAMGLYELALADLRSGKKARAHMYVKMAKEAFADEPKINELLANWANAEALAKKESEDQRLFAEAIRYEESGDYEKAIVTLKKAISVNDSAPELHNRLGVILATRVKDYSAATHSLMKAVELDSKNLVYRSNLGKVFKMSEGKNVGALISDHTAVPQGPVTPPPPKSMLDKLRGKLK